MDQSKDPMHHDLEKASRIASILKKCIDQERLDNHEQQLLDEWIAASPHNRKVYEEVTDPEQLEKDIKEIVGYNKKELWGRIKAGTQSRPGILSFFRSPVGRYAAAIAVLLIGVGVYFFVIKKSSSAENKAVAENTPTIKQDLAPGTDKAVLQLSDGTSIILEDANNGLLSKQGNADISKEGGMLSYSLTGAIATTSGNNTLKIPRGGKWALTLSDGSTVILNSESSITYPVAFTGNSRDVTVTGEAYFEVAKDAKRPFRVTAKEMTVEVLGTHFNVNTYGDKDEVQTTLLEGAVRVTAGTQKAQLHPGQQSIITTTGKLQLNPNADISKIMAWRDNSFYFQNDDIETIMKQLARWYDVQIVYEGKITKTYTGQLSRNIKVSEMFQFLEMSGGIKFRIDDSGKKIIVRPTN
jgi:transmembrane sensor